MSLVHSARLNGHEPHAYLEDHPRAVADAAGQLYRGVVAPSLAASGDLMSCARRQDGITARSLKVDAASG